MAACFTFISSLDPTSETPLTVLDVILPEIEEWLSPNTFKTTKTLTVERIELQWLL